ncbi:MAG: phosphotransferase, partial [Acidimicrobiales bacterium]
APSLPTAAGVVLHGDLHAKNAMLTGRGSLGFVDLDQAGIGAASADLGSALAALRYHDVVAPTSGPVGAAKRLLEGYETRRPLPPPTELAWYTAAARRAGAASRQPGPPRGARPPRRGADPRPRDPLGGPVVTGTVLFHVQHFLGMGHLIRAFTLAEAMTSRFRVVIVSGGRLPQGVAVPGGVELITLPALGMDDERQLASGDPGRTVEQVLDERRRRLIEIHDRVRPSVVLVELFPFGRKKLAPELVPLIEHARRDPRGPLVVTSIRDLLVTGRMDQRRHDARAADLLERYFDLVLVHSDPGFAVLEDSFSAPSPLGVPVVYTGFVARPESTTASPESVEPGSVVVSAGGGWAGGALMRAAIDAHPVLWKRRRLPMTLIPGPLVDAAARQELDALAESRRGLTVVGSVPDLLVTLRTAAVSISQCGYNTTMDLLRARVPAVLVPFGDERENEQPRRAARLAAHGLATVVRPGSADGPALVAAVERMAGTVPPKVAWSIDGAERATNALDHARFLRRSAS